MKIEKNKLHQLLMHYKKISTGQICKNEIDLDKLLYSNLTQRLLRLNDKSLVLKNPKIIKFININYNLLNPSIMK